MAGTFQDLLAELFGPLDGVTLRKMFGGIGVFKDAIMFGLVDRETLYLRVDEASRAAFDAERSVQFVYTGRKGRPVAMPYFQVPERLYDEPDEFVVWSAMAFAAARRATAEKAKPAKKRMARAPKVAASPKRAPRK